MIERSDRLISYNIVYERNYLTSNEFESLHSMFPLDASEFIPHVEEINEVNFDLIDTSLAEKEIKKILSEMVARDYLATGYIGNNYYVDLFDIGDDFINVIFEFSPDGPSIIMLAIYHKGLVS